MENISQEQLSKASTTLATMLDYLGLDATVNPEETNGNIKLNVNSEEAGRIIGKRGQTLSQLQMLLNRMVMQPGPGNPRIYIDVDGYSSMPGGSRDRGPRRDEDRDPRDRRPRRDDDRGPRDRGPRRNDDRDRDGSRESRDPLSEEEREEKLAQQALDAAKEVKRWGEPVTMPPMNSHDRRIVHVTLQEDEEVVSESSGGDDDRMKKVVISLKKED